VYSARVTWSASCCASRAWSACWAARTASKRSSSAGGNALTELRKDELELVAILQSRAAAEQEKMKQCEAAGNTEGAEKARAREQEYLQQADDLVKEAKETVRKQSDVEAEEDKARNRAR